MIQVILWWNLWSTILTKCNSFLAFFGSVTSDVKNQLFQQYHMSMYGRNMRMFDDSTFEELVIEWRKALRRLWGVPYRTHSKLFHVFQGNCQLMLSCVEDFLIFSSKNSVVHNVLVASVLNISRMGRNFRYICSRYGFDIWKLLLS